MSTIVASKQIGDISYFCRNFTTLCNIVEYEQISTGKDSSKELNPKTGKLSKFVSFSRHMTAATLRNSKRWVYGVRVDGTKLSNRYHLEPFSFTGVNVDKRGLRIKEIVKYDTGECKLSFVNWPPMWVSSRIFDYFEGLILSQSNEFNTSHKLVIQTEGKRRNQGRLIDTKYTYNVIHGDSGKLISSFDSLPDYVKYMLLKGVSTNEYEERLWSNSKYVDISGCIKGVIVPKSTFSNFETSDDPNVMLLRDICDNTLGEYSITYY